MTEERRASTAWSEWRSEQLMRRLEREGVGHDLAAFVRAAAAHGDRTAACFFDDNVTLTYADLLSRVTRLASSLSAIGVARGTHVGVMLPTDPRYPITWLALTTLGAVTIPINPLYTSRELNQVLSNGDAEFLVIEIGLLPTFLELSTPPIPLRCLITAGGAHPGARASLEALLDSGTEWSLSHEPEPDDLANIQYTSGTTGVPKGAMLSHRYWLTMARVGAAQLQDSVSRVLIAQPFHYIDGQWLFLMTMALGGTAFIARRQSAGRFFGWVQQFGIEYCNFPEVVAKQPEQPSDRNNQLRVIYCYSYRPENYARCEERYGCLARQGFSMTETGLAAYVPMEASHMTGTRTVGIPTGFRDVMIADEGGHEVGTDTVGEICVRGSGMFQGYYGMPNATKEAFLPGGWFKTGDWGKRSADGWFYYLGRKKDVVKRSGENISAMEVETVLRGMPEVLEAAVVPVPDDLRGQEVKAYIIPVPGITAAELPPASIIAYCAQYLAKFKLPRYIEYVTEFPRTPSRKIAKAALVASKPDLRAGAFDVAEGVWR